LGRICAKCSAENPPASNFCGRCGSSLADIKGAASSVALAAAHSAIRFTPAQPDDSSAAGGERKTVTALFADIKGSTELMEELDPEEARAIIDPALKLMMDAVRHYDGYVVQSTGDGIFALFGAPVAHEDHPQRALYAALRLQEGARTYSAKLVADGGTPLEARVGINTGEVVVRTLTTAEGHAEYTPIGHTANLASRMQAVAPTGSIAITEHTRRLVEGYFQLKARGPTRVKGLSGPINVYEVTGLGPLRTRLQRSVGRGLTKFVGREREMEALKHAADQAKAGRGQVVAAMAEAGVGKSRLFFEFKAVSQSGWKVLEAFSVSHGKASAYLPLIDLLHSYFEIATEDDPRRRREKIAGKVVILDRALEDTLPYLYGLLGVDEGDDPLAGMDANLRKRRTLEVIKRIMLRESLNQPLMVIFEDLHWIDDETQEFLNLLADSIGTAKILLLVNYRPEYSHQWNRKTYYTQLRLDPLGRESAGEMLGALLSMPVVHSGAGEGKGIKESGADEGDNLAPLTRLIIERTDGNPFFMEEMVQGLFEEGALVRNGAVQLTRPLSELRIPLTVQAILAARIDRLPPQGKDLLQTLAVIGKEFPLGLVREVWQTPHSARTTGEAQPELEQMLGDLQLAEFIYEQPAVDDLEYTFKHALTQEVAYNSVLIERRRLLHERIGAAMEATFAQSIEDHLSEVAHHYSRSGNTRKAVQSLVLSAEQATRRTAYAEAAASLAQGLEMLQRLPADRERDRDELKLQTALINCLTPTHNPGSPEVRAAMERALEISRQLEDRSEIFRSLVSLRLSYAFWDLQKARELAEQALAIAQDTGDPTMLVLAQAAIAQVLLYQGELAQSREHLVRSLSSFESGFRWQKLALFDAFPRVIVQAFLAWNLWLLGYPEQAIESVGQTLAQARQESNEYVRSVGQLTTLYARACLRDAQLHTEVRSILAAATERGYSLLVVMSRFLQAWTLARASGGPEEIEVMEQTLLGIPLLWAGWFNVLLAEVYGKAGRAAEAFARLELASRMIGECDARLYLAELHRVRGELILMHNSANITAAERSFRTAIDIARVQSAKSWELRATMSLARLLRETGRRDEARTALAQIYGWFTEGFDTADLKDAKDLLDQLAN